MTHAARAHARFAPSAAHRWVNCTGSVSLCETVPRQSTPAADEGTAAHMLAEHCLNHGTDAEYHYGDKMTVRPGVDILVDEEMVDGVNMYVDYVRAIMDQCETFAIEAKLDLTHINEGMFGTGDFIGYDEQNRRLHVVDFKFGRNAVSPSENYQALAYAMGAVARYEGKKIEDIYITIVQPRVSKTPLIWTTDRALLRVYQNKFAKAAFEADHTPEFVAGDWCKYCPAAAICPTARDKAHEIARAEFGPQGMKLPDVAKITRADLGAILSEIDQLEDWVKRVKTFAFEEAVAGRVPPGHKLVAKRGVRRWKSDGRDIALCLEEFGLDQTEIYEDPKLLSPAKLEKKLSKGDRKLLNEQLVEKVSSGIKLVSENDPGVPIAPDAAAELSKVEIDE